MKILKLMVITFLLFVTLVIGSIFLLIGRIPTKLLNKISIEESIQLAENCQIRTIAKPHIGGIFITLTNGTEKFLEDKYEISNHQAVYDQNYNRFFQLLDNSKINCGFQTLSIIE